MTIHFRPLPWASRSALRNIRVETHARLRDEIRTAIEKTPALPRAFGRADLSDKRERKTARHQDYHLHGAP